MLCGGGEGRGKVGGRRWRWRWRTRHLTNVFIHARDDGGGANGPVPVYKATKSTQTERQQVTTFSYHRSELHLGCLNSEWNVTK